MSGEHFRAGSRGPVLCSRDLHDADCFGQLSGRDGGVFSRIGLDVPGRNDDGHVYGKRRLGKQP